MGKLKEQLNGNTKNIKREIIFADVAILILGLLMVIFPGHSNNIICITGGILLGIWGLIRLVTYFAAVKNGPFSSFGLVQGATLVSFAIFFIVAPHVIAPFLVAVMGLILMISAVLKIQYTVDFLRLKEKFWYVALIGAIVAITLGTITFFNLKNTGTGIMLYLGISFLVNGVWDIVSVLLLSNVSKPLSIEEKASEDEDKKEKKRLKDKN